MVCAMASETFFCVRTCAEAGDDSAAATAKLATAFDSGDMG